ncbi:Sulfotransferase 1C4 [Stylophora pistillata]|uniref:Sulfotransferase 1C4 n=2 Tax=Stylophora pistillata TaxID=50429 RepID=A0A2B4RCM7_STYPI|nr:Sulfotransferase 1C4 [Stylophora pistillata]
MGDQIEPLGLKEFHLGKDVRKEMMDVLPKLPAWKEDIFVASYPRSGSTWTQEIVWQILHDGQIDQRRLDERVPFVEGMILGIKSYPYTVTDAKSAVKVFTSFPKPRVFKTHLPYSLVPMGLDEANKPRYIYVMRNPKDVFVSIYNHRRNMPYLVEFPTWDEAFKRLITGDSAFGLHFDHVLGWWKQRDDPNILFLTYEERIKDPEDAVQKIAKFIGKEISLETRDLIVRQTSFDAMKSSNYTPILLGLKE